MVATTHLQPRSVEALDGDAALCGERDMDAAIHPACCNPEPERRNALRAKARTRTVSRAQLISKCPERTLVEAYAHVEISYSQAYVIEHAPPPREVSLDGAGDPILENLAISLGSLTETARRDPGSAVKRADEVGQIHESDI